MASLKYKKQDGTFTKVPLTVTNTPTKWENVEDKPFTSLDSETLSVDESGILSVIGGSGGTSVGDVYSTDEIRIGTWIDGKPLYRKVVFIDSWKLNTSTTGYKELSTDTTFELKNAYGFFTASGNIYQIPNNFYNDAGTSNIVRINVYQASSKSIGLRFWQTISSTVDFTNFYITLEYTKTTD